MTDKIEAKKAVEKKVEVKKAPAKKPAAKKAPAKKPVAKKPATSKIRKEMQDVRKEMKDVEKEVRKEVKKEVKKVVDKTQTVFEKLEDSVIAVPFKAANKTFMASLGLFSYVQKEFDKKFNEFDKTFNKYAKDGEKVFGVWEHKVEDFRKDVEEKVDGARDKVRETFKKAA